MRYFLTDFIDIYQSFKICIFQFFYVSEGLSYFLCYSFTDKADTQGEYKDLIEKNGGKNVGSISAKTSFILAGENMGPAKLEKAQKLGVQIMSEDEFLALIS